MPDDSGNQTALNPTAPLHVFRDPPLDGPTNMARDEHLLYAADVRPAALRIYAWDPPTISLGYFQRFAAVAELPDEVRHLALVRRLTGGGAILHDREVTYCLALDDALPAARQGPIALYRAVHDAWRVALGPLAANVELAPPEFPLPTPRTGPFFCFEKPGQTDLMRGGGKLLGSAQRRIPGRVLQHGSLLLGQRFAAHPGVHLGDPPPEHVEAAVRNFIAEIANRLGLAVHPAAWTPGREADIAARRTRYISPEWTQRY